MIDDSGVSGPIAAAFGKAVGAFNPVREVGAGEIAKHVRYVRMASAFMKAAGEIADALTDDADDATIIAAFRKAAVDIVAAEGGAAAVEGGDGHGAGAAAAADAPPDGAGDRVVEADPGDLPLVT